MKIFMIVQKITHMRRWGTSQNLLLTFIDFEKSKKSEFWKNEKEKKNGNIITLHMCTKNHNYVRYSSSDKEWDNFFLSFWAIICPKNPEKQNFEEMKKASGDHFQLVIISVIILNLYNKEHDHMMYAYSDMECDRHDFLSF